MTTQTPNSTQDPRNINASPADRKTQILWILVGVFALGLLFSRAMYSEYIGLTIITGLPLLAVLGALVVQNQKALKSRTAAYGLNSVVTVLLVIGIVGVVDFLTLRYPLKLDLTKNKLHTLSDQTTKLIKGLQKPVKATFFAKLGNRDQVRPLLDSYKALNPKFEVEYVDPDKEVTRTQRSGIKKYGTLLLSANERENKVEEVTEEKLTNTLIKLLKDKAPVLCAITGHGEKSFTSDEAEGYNLVRKALTDQSYSVQEVNIIKETKIPDNCDAIAIMGPTKAFFPAEVSAIETYLDNGGRGVFALDVNIKGGGEMVPELLPVLASWYVQPVAGLIVDPLSRMLGVDSSVAIVASFSKDHVITKDLNKDTPGNALFPFSRPLEILPSVPPSLHVDWIGQTTPKSWAVMDLKQLAKGEVQFVKGTDKPGPLNAVVTVEGKKKDSKAAKNTRLVVFASSYSPTNNYSRFGLNSDFFLNSVSWVVEDESLISIRAKDDAPGKVELSEKSGVFVFLVTVVLIPLFIAISGFVIWIFRRRM